MDDAKFLSATASQFGEDVQILRMLREYASPRGIYIDAGAFHPVHISNTYLLHLAGWRGINIDFDEDKVDLFHKLRPDDYSVVAALSDRDEIEAVANTYPSKCTNRLSLEGSSISTIGDTPSSTRKVKTQTLTSILDRSPFAGEPVDLLSVDCEGHDLAVLRGYDFNRSRPKIVCVEVRPHDDSVSRFLENVNYRYKLTMGLSALFVDAT